MTSNRLITGVKGHHDTLDGPKRRSRIFKNTQIHFVRLLDHIHALGSLDS